jgi:hypothetical protein
LTTFRNTQRECELAIFVTDAEGQKICSAEPPSYESSHPSVAEARAHLDTVLDAAGKGDRAEVGNADCTAFDIISVDGVIVGYAQIE